MDGLEQLSLANILCVCDGPQPSGARRLKACYATMYALAKACTQEESGLMRPAFFIEVALPVRLTQRRRLRERCFNLRLYFSTGVS